MPIEGINLSPKMRTGFIPLDINAARIVGSTAGETWANATGAAGTPIAFLSSATSPVYQAISTAARAAVVQWTSAGTPQIQFPTVILPPDFSSLSAPTVNVISGRVSAASSDTSPAWTVNVYAAGGSTVAALTMPITNITSSVATQYSVAMSTVQTGGLGYPNVLTVLLNPASSQDLNRLFGAWIEYTKTARG